ncbi:MAG: DUF4386 domain-containing protein [Christensenellales bacterium]
MNPTQKTARLAGFLWLLMIIFGLFAQVGVREGLIVAGDAAATAANITADPLRFRIGFVSDLVMLVCYLLTPLVFYRLLSGVSKPLATLSVIFAMVGTAIGMLGLLCEFAALQVLSNASYLGAFPAGQLQAQMMLLLDLNDHAYMIGHIFFALWVLPLGLLIYRSRFLPRVFGVLFLLETLTGLLAVLVHFLSPSPELETNLMCLGAAAEISFTLWLLVRGIHQAPAPALSPAPVTP